MKKVSSPPVNVFSILTSSSIAVSGLLSLVDLFKKTMLASFIFCLLVVQHACVNAQDSSHIRISLLTCTPGEELYSTWGHTAIRVTDSSSVTDNVFNYGTFNFDDPGFYSKFVRGKLLYYLSVGNFQDFKDEYQANNRGITEQVLNMDAREKIALMEALYDNSKEENRYYQYDFFLDNCTTRARDILVKYKGDRPAFKQVMPEGTRFRQAIHLYLDKGKKYWGKLGIDILLGVPTDAVMTMTQSQFLPDNLMMAIDSADHGHGLVLSTANLYPVKQEKDDLFQLTPALVFSLLLVAVIILSFINSDRTRAILQGFDGIFFFLTGLVGIILIFMWTGTDHSMTKGNYNLLWAWPTNIIIAFFVSSKKKWVARYFGFSMIALSIVLLSWFFLPQQLNSALIPLVLIQIGRSALKYLASLS